MSSDNTELQNAFSEVLQKHSIASYELPELRPIEPKVEPSWLEQWFQKIAKWIASLFPDKSNSSLDINPQTLDLVMSILYGAFYVVIGGLVLWGLYAIYKKFFHQGKKTAKTLTSPLGENFLNEKQLLDLIDQALKNSDWARAARLRWIYYLKKIRKAPSLTPLELFKNTYIQSQEGHWVVKFYDLAFGHFMHNSQTYEDIHRSLLQLESQQK